MCFRLGSGDSSIWYKDWFGHGKIGALLPFVNISDTHLYLRDIIQHNQWNLDQLHTLIPVEMVAWFSSVAPNLHPNALDSWVWDESEVGIYSVRDGYSWLRKNNTTHDT